jgi:hypothetical protein
MDSYKLTRVRRNDLFHRFYRFYPILAAESRGILFGAVR